MTFDKASRTCYTFDVLNPDFLIVLNKVDAANNTIDLPVLLETSFPFLGSFFTCVAVYFIVAPLFSFFAFSSLSTLQLNLIYN